VGEHGACELARPVDLANEQLETSAMRAKPASPILVLIAGTMLALNSPCGAAAEDADRIRALEAQLNAARARAFELETTLAALAADLAMLKQEAGSSSREVAATQAERERREGFSRSAGRIDDVESQRREGILAPDLGADERGGELAARPELFLQTGFAAERIDGATPDDAVENFTLNRLEMRWAGPIAERLGLGVELQYHPAPNGASEELVNDAFVEYYASDAITLRVGQFVKPFGFDVQHSSAARESPERAIFAGYFVPGQRDRGAMLAADLGDVAEWLDGTSFYGGVFNGNRFFDDDNDDLNVNLRVRKVFPLRPFAIGASWESGKQLLPPGVVQGDRSTLYGVDAQWVLGRLGIRAEYARGAMPSTLLALEPTFAAGFEPGLKTWGASAFFDYRFTVADEMYWRWDRLDNDPVSRANVRAFNVGYLRRLGESSRLGFDYQWKDDVTFNDDELNTQLTIRLNVVY
jgi:hypothetical protein